MKSGFNGNPRSTGFWRIPPVGEITEKTEEDSRSNRRPIALIGSPALPAIPDLRPLGCRVINATSLFHIHTPSLIKD